MSLRCVRVVLLAGAVGLASGCDSGGGGGGGDVVRELSFVAPEQCAQCHPRQYAEWQGSMMRYGAISPVFSALEAVGNSLNDGDFAADGEQALFCQQCHTPISVALEEFPPFAETEGRPSRDFLGDIGRHGLSCDFCHQVSHADLEASPLGDGIANASFVMETGDVKFGPIADPMLSPFHDARQSDYLSSSEFCGSCHDVRIDAEDAVTGEPFLRLENLFTEWREGPYATTANPHGRVISCQDCHMSAYPYEAPGTYFTDQVATYGNPPLRRASTHYFTGVDIALIDFPGQDTQGNDSHGLPIGQDDRRRDLLRAACTLELEVDGPSEDGRTLPISVGVTNVGAGHNVPSGFSQERQVWIELTVSGAAGEEIYRSGFLVDHAHPETGEMVPDGSLDDEDLENYHAEIDPATTEATIEYGPDRNQRPEVNLGLMNFGNQFRRVGTFGNEEVLSPFLANHMDNSHSLPPLETVWTQYDVPLPDAISGPVQVGVRLRFRAFPPHFLRLLAQARPDLVDEALVDRNRIIDMAEAEATIDLGS